MTSPLVMAGLAGLLLSAAPAAAQSPAPPAGVLIVRGSATVSQKPDLAHLSLSVVTMGPTLDAAARDHAARAARAGAALAQWASKARRSTRDPSASSRTASRSRRANLPASRS